MQKKVAHYNLGSMKELISANEYFITQSARRDYVALGLDDAVVIKIIMSLVPRDLHKSMTTYADNKIWQDVYHKSIDELGLELYIKLQVSDKAIVISFKEK